MITLSRINASGPGEFRSGKDKALNALTKDTAHFGALLEVRVGDNPNQGKGQKRVCKHYRVACEGPFSEILVSVCEKRQMIGVLDLFSGIGGFSFALKNPFCTAAYCEKSPRCQNVLRSNMSRGIIDTAPILSDVLDVCEEDVTRCERPIEMITAGSPCQDISRANRYATGIEGPKSHLIFEVFRIARMIPTLRFILLENSPFIQNRGLEHVLRHVAQMGWNAVWSIFDAREAGALHKRHRWFCLLSRPGAEFPAMGAPVRMPVTPEPRRCAPVCTTTTHRNAMLGNAVVPQIVRLALYELIGIARSQTSIHPRQPGYQNRCVSLQDPQGKQSTLWRAWKECSHSPVDITMQQGSVVVKRSTWATPTATRWNRTAELTYRRATTHLAVQIQYDLDTRTRALRDFGTDDMYKFNVNPEFVEWLMGFPIGYTSPATSVGT